METALHLACRSGSMSCLRELLYICPEGMIDKENRNGQTARHIAIMNNNEDCLLQMIKKGDWYYRIAGCPLHLACHHKSHECMTLLMKYVGIDESDKKRDKPIHISARLHDIVGIRLLMNKDVKNKLLLTDDGYTPLFAALSTGKLPSKDIMEIFCEKIGLREALQINEPILAESPTKKVLNVLYDLIICSMWVSWLYTLDEQFHPCPPEPYFWQNDVVIKEVGQWIDSVEPFC
eukprot:TRINITY_DN44462_c0_g1_i2.p1 TRINITY_DN44462_c0_g1~~TRINITY_DN44462_c0_g1_i2.p1  ORF type:complete len:234 (+),score=50.49 TRINITY_DN44462_c0_g1_i2:747-1448(+)